MIETREYREIRKIAEQYDTGAIVYMAPLSSGSSSDAWRIDSEKGSWILRKCHSIMAAADEYAISEVLSETDLTSRIVCTKDKERYAFGNNGVYNLQTRLEGEPVTEVNEAIMKKTAELLVTIHQTMADAKLYLHGSDRFSLHHLSWNDLEKARQIPETYPLLKELDKLYAFEAEGKECIHGDAGIWNLLCDNGTIRIIDFGEAHMGNTYTDHAGFLVSALEHKDPETALSLLETYLDAAQEAGRTLDPAILHKAFRLWLLKGIFASFTFENHEGLVKQAMKTYSLFQDVFRKL